MIARSGCCSTSWRATVTKRILTESLLASRRFRKKPVVIEAMSWDGSRPSIEACCRWVNEGAEEPILSYVFTGPDDVSDVRIWTLEGEHLVSPGDWIIKGVAGEFYACKPDIFEATYEPA